MSQPARVSDFMATELLTLQPDTDIFEVVDFLVRHKISGAPVVDDDGNLVGVISEKDCLNILSKGSSDTLAQGVARDFMTAEPETLPPDMDIYFAAGRFLGRPFRRFPVVEDGKLVGQISRRDVLRAIQSVARERSQKIAPMAKSVG